MKAWLVVENVDSVEKARDTSFCMVMPRFCLTLFDSCFWLSVWFDGESSSTGFTAYRRRVGQPFEKFLAFELAQIGRIARLWPRSLPKLAC